MNADREISRSAASEFGPPPSSPIAPLDMLRRVTRKMAATQDLSALLHSITSALVEHTGAATARVFLYLSDEECETCRTRGAVGLLQSGGERCLHLSAHAGALADLADAHHLIPLNVPADLVTVVVERRPFLTNDLVRDSRPDAVGEQTRRRSEHGLSAAGAYPLEFRGEILGVIGMMGRQPFDPREFELLGIFADQAAMAIRSAYLFADLERRKDRLQVENAYLRNEIRTESGFEEIVGQSPTLRAVLRKVQQVARVETTVLLTGETGTGKELVARAIHALSPRKDRSLIKVNCGAIPQGVVESELFGHEKGAFTGALQRRIGRFELADKGTLFMDEVGELPLDTQVKLLRVLQEQEFERVGGTRLMKVDVRLVAATNRDLEKETADGRFRPDLFYRLNVFPIRVPPLRERPSDIPMLVHHFLAQFQRKLAKPLKVVTAGSMERLERYAWPGNIRELQNVIERSCVLARGPVVDIAEALGGAATEAKAPGDAADDRIVTLDENERMHIRRALAASGEKIHGPKGAAALLGINPSTLRSRMEKLGIDKRVS